MRNRISPATVISCVALFFSLGGVGVAASRYLITSTSQIKPSVRQALQGRRGPAGPKGTDGQPGAQGPVGASGPSGTVAWNATYIVQQGPSSLDSGNPTAHVEVSCKPGDHIITGGFNGTNEIATANQLVRVPGYQSWEAGYQHWEVDAHLDTSSSIGTVGAWALCATS